MKKLFLLLSFLIFFTPLASAQVSSGTAYRIYSGTSLPAVCNPGPGVTDVFIKTSATQGIYFCSATNTWTASGGGGGGTPGGSDTQLQYNNAGAFGGITNVTSNGTDLTALGVAGIITHTSANSAAFVSGPNGATNPVFQIDNSAGGSNNGFKLTGSNGNSNVITTAQGGGTNIGFTFTPKGSGNFAIQNSSLVLTPSVTTGTGSGSGLSLIGNSLTTGNLMEISSSSGTTGKILSIADTSTATSGTGFRGLDIALSGAVTGTVTSTGAVISNTKTGASATNVALTLTASGATTQNTALNVTAGVVTKTQDNIGATSTDGIVIQNTTAAAAGAQQWSPRLHLIGQGWKTNSTAASQTVDWIAEVQPVQGAAAPTANLVFSSQVNAGGYTPGYIFTSGGLLAYGGVTSSQSAWKLTSTSIQARLADDSAGVRVESGNSFYLSGHSIINTTGMHFVLGDLLTWNNSSNDPTVAADLTIRRAAAANLALGAADADTNASIVAQNLSVQNVSAGGTADQAGKGFTIKGSQGKGTGAGGSILFQVAGTGSSGTVVNALGTALSIIPGTGTIAAGVSVTATAAGTAPSITTTSSGTNEGLNVLAKGTGPILVGNTNNGDMYFGGNGTTSFPYVFLNTSVFQIRSGVQFGWSNSSSNASSTADLILRRGAAANLVFGGSDAASPVAQTISVQNVVAGTSNTAGVNWTRKASAGTGTGAGGSHIWQVAPAGSTGTSQNSFVTALTIDSNVHLITGGTSPTIGGSCGTSPSLVGTDMAGKVTTGSVAPTSCTVTFNKAFTNAPACIGVNETTSNLLRSTSTTTTLIMQGTMVAGDVLAYVCSGY